ncbi:lipocalin family protein [Paraburkholderia caribensis]|uniref:Outer membrane lipoprotein Blc n=1 Tax=Paraburkholderia caribensis TaxID=75105 RepID=A0ABV0DRC9_9BURK|nr:lipocalin family protein [Paraburkholderia caribensis]ALP62163.1 lipocalin [Paraburkholderia caribensis]AUT52607.1 lipocalin [Paraburkholderia caribensis]MCO4876487.1 lipocalin family protein [Paraburkholderia caribensis]
MSVEQNISQEIGHNGSHARAVIAGAVVVAVGVLVACALVIRRKKGVARVPEPAKSVDVDRYTGRWYEFARYDNRFERGRDFVTADYAKRDDGLISVINTGREGGADGPRRVARGKARVVPDSDNAKLKVSFFGPFYVGDYWVLDHADDYSWSIVGEPGGTYLWILTREAKPAVELQRALLERVRAMGYDLSMLRRTQQ